MSQYKYVFMYQATPKKQLKLNSLKSKATLRRGQEIALLIKKRVIIHTYRLRTKSIFLVIFRKTLYCNFFNIKASSAKVDKISREK